MFFNHVSSDFPVAVPVGWNVADIVCLLYMLASLRRMSAPMGGPPVAPAG